MIEMFQNLLGSLIHKLKINIIIGRRGDQVRSENQSGGVTAGRVGTLNIGEQRSGPKLYIVEGPSHSGGPNGYFFSFTIKNIGDQPALDIYWGYQADNLDFHDGGRLVHELSPLNSYSTPRIDYESSKLFNKELHNPRIVLLYKDPAGNSRSNEILIGQEGRDDGRYNVAPRL